MTNLQKRILAAFIYFPLLLLSAYQLNLFATVIALCTIVAWHEYLCFRGKPTNNKDWVTHWLCILWASLPIVGFVLELTVLLPILVMGTAAQVWLVLWIIQGRNFEDLIYEAEFYLFGVFYITGLFSSLVLLRSEPGGMIAVWFLFFVVGAADVGAYTIGKLFGSTPFFSTISPSKTREGFWGAMLSGLLMALVLYTLLHDRLGFTMPNLYWVLASGLLIAIASVFGDLAESFLKRHYNVKDSGTILPGHGGILDRFDGAMFAALPFLLCVLLMGGFQ